MSEERIVFKKWIEDGEKIAVWGGSWWPRVYLECIMEQYAFSPSIVIDKEPIEGAIRFEDTPRDERKKYKFLILTTSRKSFAEVYEKLYSEEIYYEDGFIDGLQLLGGSNIQYELSSVVIYAPWVSEEFTNIFNRIKDNTLVDKPKLYNLFSLVGQSQKCKEGDMIEIGVWKGGSGVLIAKARDYFDISCKVFLVDTFEGVVKVSDRDRFYNGGEHEISDSYVRDLIDREDISNIEVIKACFPEGVSDEIKHNKYRLVHLDVDIFYAAKDIFECLWPQVVIGGSVVFDDYGCLTTNGVRDYLNEIKNQIEDGVFLQGINGQAYFIKF